MNYFSFLLETLWKPSWALNLKQQPRLIYVYSGEIKKWSFFGLCSSYPLIRISQFMRVGEGLVQKTCNIHFPFPDCSNIREGTFKMNCYGECVFGNRNNKVIMPKNKGLSHVQDNYNLI